MTDPTAIDAAHEAPPTASAPPEPPAAPPADPASPAEPEGRQGAGDGDLGDAGRKALAKEREAAREAKAEAERLKSERDAATERIRELEAAELRRTVAAEKRLTPEQAELLRGESVEELADHADKLLAAFAPPKSDRLDVRRRPVERLTPGAVPEVDPERESVSDVADRIAAG